ncbi:glutathione S-transferase [Sphingomonas ginsenosidivorax]|uniref:Glutathione S-transferase n=1 Tax=Sphingomonas ginsenosidivorax TaxID=862135 RepID=A0A5C6UDW4_9SPHN|nr:glutathione S-transferase [Sphingomonas ginsenosidivorax]TXC70600.1 glutathione S-transferase [Sphingomonas ginsenosidivorax]
MDGYPLLYSFRRCPYAIRARLALLASGTACIIREVKLSAKPAEMLAASPKATVPVLITPDGRVIDQSLDIMRWALSSRDPAGWLDHEDTHLIATNDDAFKHHLDRAKYPERHDGDPAPHRAACIDLLRPLEDRLRTTRHLCGETPGLTDAAILPFVRQFASIDRDWFDAQPLPYVRAWLDRWVASDGFEAAMVRLTPWRAGDPDVLFPSAQDPETPAPADRPGRGYSEGLLR